MESETVPSAPTYTPAANRAIMAQHPRRALLHYQLRMLLNNGLAVPNSDSISYTRSGDQTVLVNKYNKRKTNRAGGNRRCKIITTYQVNRSVRRRENRNLLTKIMKECRNNAVQTGNQILFVSISSEGVMNVFHHGNIPAITQALEQSLQKSELPEEQRKTDAWMYPEAVDKIYINNCLTRNPEPLEVVRKTVDPTITEARSRRAWSQEPFNSRTEGIVGYRQYDTLPLVLTGECFCTLKDSTLHAIQRHQAGKQATLTPAQMEAARVIQQNYHALHPTLDVSKSTAVSGVNKRSVRKSEPKIKIEKSE